ncbi:hypothetical protein D1007_34829 [Hordeum vulgare]|nr:hypothetical protein D1007_34829 [Hordeum vulgare]
MVHVPLHAGARRRWQHHQHPQPRNHGELGILDSEVQPTHKVFHDIVPGQSCSLIGKVQLDVLFGSLKNFRREPIWFEVVNLSSSYQAILGRPALAKFTVVPHYAYLKMKLSGPHGIITVAGNYKKPSECALGGSKLTEYLVMIEEQQQIDRLVARGRRTILPRQR